MENNENIPQHQENEYNIPNASPFADSPYVMEQPQEPVQTGKPKKNRSKKGLRTFFVSLLVIALGATACGVTAFFVNNYWSLQQKTVLNDLYVQINKLEEEIKDNSYTGQGNSISGTPTPSEGLTPGQVHAQNKNSVVGIANQGITTNIFGQVTETASSGSGFILSEDGYIVTNYHVIEDASTLTVITNSEEEYPATVVGYDESNDFALIKIDATGLTPVKLGSSDDLIVGDQVVAIGNPLGELTFSMSGGMVSSVNRAINVDGTPFNMLQVDCAINPGNSGGPLMNLYGEVVGIVSAKYSSYSNTTVEGLGFAIPISDVQTIITDIIENGEVTDKAYLAITAGTMTAEMAAQYSIDLDKGVFVYSVVKGGAGDRAGLRLGDIITEMDGKTVNDMTDLSMAKKGRKAGETVSLTYYRDGEYHETELTFDEQPETTGEEEVQSQPQMPEQYEDYYNQMPDGFEDFFRYFFGRGW